MKETKNIKVDDWNKANLVEFNSIYEFVKYLDETPYNNAFKNEMYKLSEYGRYEFTQTRDLEQAREYMLGGWSTGIVDLNKKLKTAESQEIKMAYRNILSIAGYQAIVPLYLNGVPNNMINKKMTPIKKKVITITKAIACSGGVSANTLQEEAIKCLQIIKKIEDSGIRVNLNLMLSTGHVFVKIKLKSSGERLNVSKLVFPLIHPSMYRRIYFNFVEKYPTIPRSFINGYGRVPQTEEFESLCGKDEIVLPTILYGTNDNDIERLSVDELIGRLK